MNSTHTLGSPLARTAGLRSVAGWLMLPATLLHLPALAQSAAPARPGNPSDAVVITANPLGNRVGASSASILAGEALILQRTGSLGDMLDGLPGVSSTGFGPNASRPILRGLDGERLRILSNGGGVLDASSLSDDHAVALDPLVATRIEVLRGPAALFFGGNALAGVVHVMDNRIPERPDRAGLQGSMEVRWGGAARERSGAAVLEGGEPGQVAWHLDAFSREAGNLRVPRFTPTTGPAFGNTAGSSTVDTVTNSAQHTEGGAAGASLQLGRVRLGAALDTFRTSYGVVATPDVSIAMKRDQLRLLAESSSDNGPWRGISAQAHLTDYRHREVEGDGTVGTAFRNRGHDLRIDARHAPLGPLQGSVGLQSEASAFSAQGEEAFVPSTYTRRSSLFLLEQLAWLGGNLSLGGRAERVSVASTGDAHTQEVSPGRFGSAADRCFNLGSLSVSQVQPLYGPWHASLSISHTERAPTSFELFAHGVHAATAAYERGNAELKPETGRNIEAALRWQDGPHRARLAVYRTSFSRFINLRDTGMRVTADGSIPAVPDAQTLPFMQFESVRAQLQGFEAEGAWRAVDRAWIVDLTAGIDLTRGENLDRAEPLARLAPLRWRAGLQAATGPWSLQLGVRHAARQSRVPAGDNATPSHTLLDGSVLRRWSSGATQGLVFLKVNNATDRLAYNASALPTVRGLSPLPGRSVSVGWRIDM